MNSLMILSKPYIARTTDFFYYWIVYPKPPVLVLRGDNPPRVTPHLVNCPVAITNW